MKCTCRHHREFHPNTQKKVWSESHGTFEK